MSSRLNMWMHTHTHNIWMHAQTCTYISTDCSPQCSMGVHEHEIRRPIGMRLSISNTKKKTTPEARQNAQSEFPSSTTTRDSSMGAREHEIMRAMRSIGSSMATHQH